MRSDNVNAQRVVNAKGCGRRLLLGRAMALACLSAFMPVSVTAQQTPVAKQRVAAVSPRAGNYKTALPKSAGGAAADAVTLEHLEITQVIQDSHNMVPLVAGKTTLVRAYLSYPSDNRIAVRGQLSVSGLTTPIPSINLLTIDPSLNGQTAQKRLSIDQSLNFLLPAQVAAAAGPLDITLSAITDGSNGSALTCSNCAASPLSGIRFVKVPPLRVTVVPLNFGVKDFSSGLIDYFAPTDLDIKMLESWMRRAYPISQLILIKHATIPVPLGNVPPSFTCVKANTIVANTRAKDISNHNADLRSHYFGLVADGGSGKYFMRGCANGQPDAPNFAVVASGPAGSNIFPWDSGPSYASWYSGHEVAHTLGRKHPGFCGETHEDPAVQSQFIGGTNNEYVGYDAGDPLLSIPPAIIPPTHTDIMTYCDNEWVSPYTYQAILNRVMAEGSVTPGGLAPVPVAGAAPQGETAPEATADDEAGGRPAPPRPQDEAPQPVATTTPSAPLQPTPQTSPEPTPGGNHTPASTPAVVPLPQSTPEPRPQAGGNAGSNAGGPASGTTEQNQDVQAGSFLTVIGTINLTKRKGELSNPFPVSMADVQSTGQDATRYPQARVLLKNKDGLTIGEYAFPVLLSTDTEEVKTADIHLPKEDQTGLVNGVIPNLLAATTLEFYLVGDDKGDTTTSTLLQTIQESRKPFQVRNISINVQPSGPGPSTSTPPLELTWDPVFSDGNKVTYNVDLSTDEGQTWKTVAVGLTTNGMNLLLGTPDIKKIVIRVTATNGLNSSVQTKKYNIK